MTVYYMDTSALLAAYVPDEPDHAELRRLLRDGESRILTNQISRIEFASGTRRAVRRHRLRDPAPVLARFASDCGPGGSINLLPFGADQVLDEAYRLVNAHPLRTLDALHVATALIDARGLDASVVFVTRDSGQTAAAEAEGLEVA